MLKEKKEKGVGSRCDRKKTPDPFVLAYTEELCDRVTQELQSLRDNHHLLDSFICEAFLPSAASRLTLALTAQKAVEE